MSRRSFAKRLAAFLVGSVGWFGGLVGWRRRARAATALTRVVTVTDGRARVGSGWANADLDPVVVRAMLERALTELTGATDAGAALVDLIPQVADPAQRYGIKINCVNADLPTHPVVVDALAALLREAGARPENIIVFDRSDSELRRCGFVVASRATASYRVYGTDHPGVGYDAAQVTLTDGTIQLSRILTEQIDHLINVPVLKNHEMAGITGALKNHFGSIFRPDTLHGRLNDGCPGIAELSALPQIQDLTRLVIIDGLFATHLAGLAAVPDYAPQSLIVATDPVAADVIARAMIDDQRQQVGEAKVEALHIEQAATLGVGVADAGAIDHVEVIPSPVLHDTEPTSPTSSGCNNVGTETAAALAAAVIVAKK